MSFSEYWKSIKTTFKKIRYDQMVGLIPQHFDILLLSIISDVSVVGVYKFAKRLVEPINYITTAFNPWIQSQYSAGKKINFNDLVIKLLLPVSLAIMLIFIFAGRKIILLIGSSDFNLAYESLIILASGYIIYLLTFWIRQSLLFNELIMHHVRGRVLYSLVFVALSVPLANTYSANGLSLSLSIAILFQKVYELYIYKKKIVPKSLH
jgi:O-antigen/teichoic acid export membrane protein